MTNSFNILLVDVDRTLYPFECKVWDAIGEQIHLFIQKKLSMSNEEARSLRIALRDKYPTTLQGLHNEYGVDQDEYLQFVHDVDLATFIPPNPDLASIFASLPQRKVIFTNSTRFHANRVMDFFSIKPYFDDVIDVTMIDPYTKFEKEAFPIALELLGNPPPQECVMIDDEDQIICNAVSAGMQGILVNKDPQVNSNQHVQIPTINHIKEALEELSEKYSSLSQV
ncbi:MAG TPA: hypothetical protein DCK95_06415 [Anaerolineaceae bacterium]|uniref:Pyrimidine 5-nucleotidase family protein n=1 Tax=Anaerolinea thermophila TaxID=167964 RepID=A0A101FXX6_9CHLR|nr:MAG: Pyrimidine 5-nucleotidase family protein [Anaerolinea thermophila]HAF61943.1 hypothetical protein [Anaerolineaceae bacterium]